MRSKGRSLWSIVIVLLVVLAGGSCRTNAQLATTTANLSGTVNDPGGALIPQAKVTLTSPETGTSRESITNESGRYSFNQLPPGTYKLAVRMDGFRPYEQTGIVLDAAQSAAQNVTLTVGTQDQQVVVNAQASNLNTQNANIAADIDAREVVELPLNLRNVYGLATLNSSVNNTSESQMLLGGGGPSTDNADQDISFLNFAGGFFGTSAYLLDGAWDTDPEWGAVDYVPSVDSVQEFKIQNNSFTAQYGWSTGNVVNVVTKSGSNAFHGDVYEFYRNSALDSNLWFNNHNGLAKRKFQSQPIRRFGGRPALYSRTLPAEREDIHFRALRKTHPGHSHQFHIHGAGCEFPRGSLCRVAGSSAGYRCAGTPDLCGADLQSAQHPPHYRGRRRPHDRPDCDQDGLYSRSHCQ